MRSVVMHGSNEAGALLRQAPSDDDAAASRAPTRSSRLVKAADAVAARICTDGRDFDFTAAVDYVGTGEGTLIESETGALTVRLEDSLLEPKQLVLTIETLSFSSLEVSQVVNNVEDLRYVQVSKDHESVCIAHAPTSEPADLAERQQCVFRPSALPAGGFQAAPLGSLKRMLNGVATVRDVTQTFGTVPVTFVVKGPAFHEAWKHDEEWKAVKDAATQALSFAAGEDTVATVDAVANVGGGVLFQGAVITPEKPGAACRAEAAIQTAIKSGTFQAAIADRMAAAKVKTSGAVGAAHAVAPGVPMKCEQVACRHSERRDSMSGAKCVGATCASSCCVEAWSKTPLPFDGAELSAAELGLPTEEMPTARMDFRFPSAPEPEPAKGEVAVPAHTKDKLFAFHALHGAKPFDVFTDGTTLSVDVKLSLAPDAFEKKQTIVEADSGAVALTALTSKTLLFEGFLTSGRKCEVESTELHAALVRVRLSKDAEACCIETTSLPELGRGRKACSKKAEGEEHFQLHPVSKLLAPVSLSGIVVKGVSQESASLTMSMTINGLSMAKLASASAMTETRAVLEQSIAFAAGVGVEASQVSVVFQHTAGEAVHHGLWVRKPAVTPSEAKARRKNAARLGRVLAGIEADEAGELEPAEEERRHEAFQTEKLIEELEAAFERDEGEAPQEQPAAGADESFAERNDWFRKLQAADSVSLQVTISGCDAGCAAIRHSIGTPAANNLILERLRRMTGDGPTGRATVGFMGISEKSAPALPTTCAAVQCGEYRVTKDPDRTCVGGSCDDACCDYAQCKDILCEGDLIPNFLHRHHKCVDGVDCQEKCCLQKCSDYDCTEVGLCPKSCMGGALAPITKVQETCCEQRTCCDACTTWCAACLQCMNEKSYCRSVAFPFLSASPRRLREAPALPSGDEAMVRRAANLSAALPAGLSAEALAEKERAAAKSIASNLDRLHAERRRLSEEAAPDARRLGAVMERIDLLKGLQEGKDERVALFLANAHAPVSRTTSLGGRWDTALAVAKSKSPEEHEHGHLPPLGGCVPHVNVPCDYYRTAVFLHHRGHKLRPSAVNTVAILTDTTHAVTCGDDSVCYVWDINSGCAHQAFFADDPDNRGPVHTVSVMEDAAFILSAGATKDGEDGVALIWDWIHGVEKTDFSCEGGVFKSSADVPVARFSLLGCSNGWVSMWDWGNGADLQLPYHLRTVREIVGAIKDRLAGYYKSNWNGWQRWAYSEHMKSKESFKTFIQGLNWEMDLDAAFWEAVDKYYELAILGSVNGIAYVRPKQRFITAGGDGKVRLWDSDSGKMLWASRCLGSSVNAVAGLPQSPLRAVSGGDDGVARLWDLKHGHQIRAFRQLGVDAPIRAIAVFPGGKRFAAGYDDGYVRIFEIYSSAPTCSIYTGSAVRGIAVNPSNPLGQIITANADGYAHVFETKKYASLGH